MGQPSSQDLRERVADAAAATSRRRSASKDMVGDRLTPLGSVFMPSSAEPAPSVPFDQERRAGGDRHAAMRLATIILDTGEQIPCVIRDLSVTGAKLGVARRYRLPESFLLLVQGHEPAFPVRRAWQRGDQAGVRLNVKA